MRGKVNILLAIGFTVLASPAGALEEQWLQYHYEQEADRSKGKRKVEQQKWILSS